MYMMQYIYALPEYASPPAAGLRSPYLSAAVDGVGRTSQQKTEVNKKQKYGSRPCSSKGTPAPVRMDSGRLSHPGTQAHKPTHQHHKQVSVPQYRYLEILLTWHWLGMPL